MPDGEGRLALGTAQLGMTYGIANTTGPPDPEQAREMLDLAWRRGVKIWDTAPSYGEIERLIGDYKREVGATPTLCTKLPPISAGRPAEDFPPDISAYVHQHVRRSLERLQTDHIDYYLIHFEGDFVRFRSDLLEALEHWRRAGAIASVGVAVYSPSIAEMAIAEPAISALQLPLNLLDHRFEPLAEAAYARQMTVFARSVFLQGLFFLEEDAIPSRVPGALEPLRRLRLLASELGRNLADLAIAYARDVPGVHALVVGSDHPRQLASNIDLLESAAPIPSAVRSEIRRAAATLPEEVISPFLWPAES